MFWNRRHLCVGEVPAAWRFERNAWLRLSGRSFSRKYRLILLLFQKPKFAPNKHDSVWEEPPTAYAVNNRFYNRETLRGNFFALASAFGWSCAVLGGICIALRCFAEKYLQRSWFLVSYLHEEAIEPFLFDGALRCRIVELHSCKDACQKDFPFYGGERNGDRCARFVWVLCV